MRERYFLDRNIILYIMIFYIANIVTCLPYTLSKSIACSFVAVRTHFASYIINIGKINIQSM